MSSSTSWTKDPNPWTHEMVARSQQYHHYGNHLIPEAQRAVRERAKYQLDRYREIKHTVSDE
jgi:hypothetical protein